MRAPDDKRAENDGSENEHQPESEAHIEPARLLDPTGYGRGSYHAGHRAGSRLRFEPKIELLWITRGWQPGRLKQ